VGIGGQFDHPDRTEIGYPNEEELNSILSKDAAGDIFAHFFDRGASPIVSEFDKALLALNLNDFCKIPVRVAAGGDAWPSPLSC
jgi:DNA-binding transcriptional regulator LsrR (DeoR family)